MQYFKTRKFSQIVGTVTILVHNCKHFQSRTKAGFRTVNILFPKVKWQFQVDSLTFSRMYRTDKEVSSWTEHLFSRETEKDIRECYWQTGRQKLR